MTRPSSIPSELWEAIPVPLPPAIAALVVGLERRVAELEQQVADLQARVGQNSSNSSKPPSSDGPHVKPAPPTKPSGRTRGGQPGHPKHERVILPPDQVSDHRPERGRRCATALTGDDPNPTLDQVLELPEKLRRVIHHRRHTLACPCGHAETTAPPVPEAATGFGPKLTAVTAYLTGVGRLGKRTVRTFFADVCDLPVSLGAVSKLEATASRARGPTHTAAHEATKGADANVGETGWKEGAKKAWLWVAVTKVLTVFLLRPHRDRTAFDDLVGPDPGVLTTDRFPVCTHLAGGRRPVCWAHLRRDFQAMIDRKNAGSGIGEELLAHADILFAHGRKVRDGTRGRRWFERTHAGWLRAEVRLLLERGSGCGCAKTAAVCQQLLAVEASLWTFAGRDGGWSRRTTRPSGRCVTPCAGGRRATARTAPAAAGSSSGC